MPETKQIIQTSNNVKQNFRDYMRKYFRSQYSFGMQYIRDIVFMLMNFKEINILERELGKEELDKTTKALQSFDRNYNYANLINDSISKMQEKGSEGSDVLKKRVQIQNGELMKVSINLPAINFRIMRAFFILVNNCDLRNVSVPKEERFDKGKIGLPSYLMSEGKSF